MNKLNFENKFKDRKPLDTVQIIKQFFTEKGYNISYHTSIAESLTWTAGVDLLLDDKIILHSNGKGMTEDFCLASGFAELYERYCNKIFYIGQPFIVNRVMEESYKKNGYYFCKNEKILKINEIWDSPNLQKFKYDLSKDNEALDYLMSTICGNKFVGVDYINILNNNDIKYFDPRILVRSNTSTGMAAGNTFEEAFNQGMSEIFEHHVEGLFHHKIFDEYKAIDINSLNNAALIEKVDAIIKSGNQFYIIDLSYNYNVPVLLSVLINNKTHSISMNMGSYPVFDLACERVITEMYQGITTMEYEKAVGQIPYKNSSVIENELYCAGSFVNSNTFPESILNKITYNNEPNYNIFLKNNTYSNIEIFNYYQDLIKALNINIYYHDYSLTNEMIALSIYASDLSTLTFRNDAAKLLSNFNHVNLTLLKIYDFLNNVININNGADFYELNEILDNFAKFNKNELFVFDNLIYNNWFSILDTERTKELSFMLLLRDDFTLLGKETANIDKYIKITDIFYDNLNKYTFLYRYLISGKYSGQEIIDILTKLNYNNINDDDVKNALNINYVLDKVFIEPLYIYFTNGYINNYINHLI